MIITLPSVLVQKILTIVYTVLCAGNQRNVLLSVCTPFLCTAGYLYDCEVITSDCFRSGLRKATLHFDDYLVCFNKLLDSIIKTLHALEMWQNEEIDKVYR